MRNFLTLSTFVLCVALLSTSAHAGECLAVGVTGAGLLRGCGLLRGRAPVRRVLRRLRGGLRRLRGC